MKLLDVLAWLLAHLQPVVVTVAAPDKGRDWLDYVSASTVVVAALGVGIAYFALRASRRSADNSARSVEKSEAALRGSIRPVLKAADPAEDGLSLIAHNIGPGIAVSVNVYVASLIGGIADGGPAYGYARTLFDVGPIAPGGQEVVKLRSVGNGHMSPGSHLHVLLQSTDVNGDQHWTEQHLRPSSPYATYVGTGEPPERLHGFFRIEGDTAPRAPS